MPAFQDKDIDSYFVSFEHAASTLEWPADKWSILLSTGSRGKAQIAYAAMGASDKCQYEMVKLAILRAYEMVPEAYRQGFRGLKKSDNQTHVEFVREKERRLDKWCKSRKVGSYDELKNLITCP